MLSTCLVLAVTLCGQPAPDSGADLAGEVRKLVRELDAPELSRREEAEQKLLALGVNALELLPETNARTPAEVALRLSRVRSQLERTQAEAAVQPSLVTLAGKELPLSEVLQQIERQTGNKLIDFREQFNQESSDPKIDVDFKETPFWLALDQVLDLAQLTVYSYAAEDGVALVSRAESQLPRSGPAGYAGSFRVEGTQFTAQRDLRDPASRMLQLDIEASWEPRLQPIVILQPADGMEATDDSGQSVVIANSGNEVEYEVTPGTKVLDLQIHFELPDRKSQKIASLKGRLSALLPGRTETFRFDGLDKAKKVEKRKAGVTVVMDEARKNNDIWEVRVRVVFDNAEGALESHRGWVFNNEAYLEDAKKKRIPPAGLETTRQTENEVGVAYLFDLPKGIKGHTLVYKTPAAIVTVPVEYELKDLELP